MQRCFFNCPNCCAIWLNANRNGCVVIQSKENFINWIVGARTFISKFAVFSVVTGLIAEKLLRHSLIVVLCNGFD